jgi:glycosyltransferase involved in cell wall biosynthesis
MIINNANVSVIIPTYNRADVIGRALHSVLHQTYQDLEVIIVDDGSTDDTEVVVRSFRDARVRYIRHENKQGAPVARNTGIKAAKAEFIAFQDSDDEWLCDKLEKQIEAFSKASPETGVVYTGFLRIENTQATYYPSGDVNRLSGSILKALLHGNFITTQAALVRKDCFLKAGLFDEQLPRLQDWELFIRIAKYYKFICINEPLLLAFYSDDSITADSSKLAVALRLILNKHHDVFSKHKKILVMHHAFLLLGRYQFIIKKAFATNPRIKRVLKKLLKWH